VSLKISEVFYSLQGEGPYIGYPSLFIRLYGCNLSCSWCDTPYAREGERFDTMEVSQLLDFWEKNYVSIPFVTLTGGEPLLQEEVYLLMRVFIAKGAVVILETNGSLSLERVPEEVVVVMDVKTPSSGMEIYNNYENFNYLKKKDAVKFVIKDESDFEWSLKIIEKYALLSKTTCLFSPCDPYLSPRKLAEMILNSKKSVRFQVQLHKILGIK